LGFGDGPAFSVCVESRCPVPTVKTLDEVSVSGLAPSRPTEGTAAPAVSSDSPAARHAEVAERSAKAELEPVAVPMRLVEGQAPRVALTAAGSGLPLEGRATAGDSAPTVPTRQATVRFEFGSAGLSEESRRQLAKLLPVARDSSRIVIAGRTDNVGPEELNDRLALARAIAVREFLRDAIPDAAATIVISGKGNCCYMSSNETAAGRAENRRVNVVFDLLKRV